MLNRIFSRIYRVLFHAKYLELPEEKHNGTIAGNPLRYGIINLTSAVNPYLVFDSIKRCYYNERNVLYKWVYNEGAERQLDDHELLYLSTCMQESGIPVMLEKFIWALRELVNQPGWRDCDYIVRTNSSTFVNLDVLERYLAILPRRRCYAGAIINNRFISGTCIVFSRDLVQYLTKIKISPRKNDYDDKVLSRYMQKKLVRMYHIPMFYAVDSKEYTEMEIKAMLERFALVRVKNNKDRNYYDVQVWNQIARLKGIVV